MTIDDTHFTIRFDTATRLIDIDVRGLWDAAAVQRFAAALARLLPQLPRLGCPLGQQVTLFDMTAFAVQPQDVLPSLAQMASSPAITSRRLAIVASGALLKMQAKRIAAHIPRFDDRAAALRWLLATD